MSQERNLHDEIAKVAYELFENSGRMYGCELEHWLAAEEIVMERYAREMGQETNLIMSSEGKKASGNAKPRKSRTSPKISEGTSRSRPKKNLPKKKTDER